MLPRGGNSRSTASVPHTHIEGTVLLTVDEQVQSTGSHKPDLEGWNQHGGGEESFTFLRCGGWMGDWIVERKQMMALTNASSCHGLAVCHFLNNVLICSMCHDGKIWLAWDNCNSGILALQQTYGI